MIDSKTNNLINELENALKSVYENDKIELESSFMQIDILKEIKYIMNKKNISRSDLCEKLNIKRKTLDALFCGDKILSLKMLYRIQQILNIKLIPKFKTLDYLNKK